MVRVKIIALFLGPVGYGVIFQFLNFLGLFTSSVHLGSPVGITAKIPALINNDQISDKNQSNSNTLADNYFVYFIRLFGVLTIGGTILFVLFSSSIVEFLVSDSNEINAFVIILFSAPFIVLYAISEAFLRCYGEFSKIVFIAITSSLGSLLLLFPLIKYLGIVGVSIYLFVSGILPFIIYSIVKWKDVRKIFIKKRINKLEYKSQILRTGSVSLLSSILFIGSNIVLRKFAIENFGLSDNGIYQSVAALSNSSFLIFYYYLSTYLLPKISAFKFIDEIRGEIDINFRFILLFMVPFLIGVFSYRYVLIRLLFSSEFIAAVDLIQYQFLGDFFRGLSGLFGLWLISKMKLLPIMLIDLVMNVVLVSLPYLSKLYFVEVTLKIIPISYMFALILHFVLFFLIALRDLKYKISYDTLKTIIFSFLLLLVTFIASLFGYLVQYIIAPFLILSFWFLATTSDEKNKILLKSRVYISDIASKFKE